MQQTNGQPSKVAVVFCLLASLAASGGFAQSEGELTAKSRVFSGVGPGLRAVRHGADGRMIVLASPSPGLLVFDKQGNRLFAIAESAAAPADGKSGRATITFGEDCDVDSDGRIYVADRGANAVQVLSPEGALLRSIPVPAPISVASLGEGEVAVATMREPHLVVVFDKNGRDVREFGDPEQLSDRSDLNRFLNIGQLASDAKGHLFYGFAYTPEPTVREYDRFGYAGQDVQYTALEAAAVAQAVRREIRRQEKKNGAPIFKRVLNAVGIDRDSGDIWMGVSNEIYRFDKEGTRRGDYKLYTPEGARLEPNIIVVQKDRLMIGNDPLGIYVFERPDKKTAQ